MVEKIAVVGAGQMGNGIAQTFATNGYDVTLIDIDEGQLSKALKMIEHSVTKLHSKGKLTDDQKEWGLGRVLTSTDLKAAKDADLVVEAVVESKTLKKDIFRRLDDLCAPETIFASNTSSISITELAAATKRPDRFVGMHFFNPVPLMQLLEVISGQQTSEEVRKEVIDLSQKLGKTPVEANDFPAFISTRILSVMLNEAVFVLQEGVGDVLAIDNAMTLGMNHPMGPLKLADFIGLDTMLSIMGVLYEGFEDPKYRTPALLRRLVHAGQLGRKTGLGFYDWSGEHPVPRSFR